MAKIKLQFPDGSSKEYDFGISGHDVAKSISPALAKNALAVNLNGKIKDLFAPIESDGSIEILTFEQDEGKEVFWHSSSHIMAQAVQELFPGTKLAIGPPIDEGWYYDFEVEKPFSPEDLQAIEKKMAEIVKENHKFVLERIKKNDAIDYYKDLDANYKIEILTEDIVDDEVTFYSQSRFKDLCRGPHLPSTGYVKAFKLTSSSGAYWRGDENKKMLQRIYGISFPKKSMLEDYVVRMEEAKKRDHRLLGKQLELFVISDKVGAGLILWRPNGARIRNQIENFWREEHIKYGYDLVFSPHVANIDLWHQSGHTEHYSEDMYTPVKVDDREYQLKPMNCPFHIEMYRARRWSYRDLPLRWAELGTVYRYEQGAVLHGLMRVRGFTQDDAHHFVAQEDMEKELLWLLDFCVHVLSSFGFTKYDIFLSTMPEKAIGIKEDWDRAEHGLRTALEKAGLPFKVDEGGGAFYGPKIDIKIKDALNRSWQCSTIQFDFSLPDRFDLFYIDKNGEQKRPYMIHRALLGSIERFFGVLIEHYAGKFPLWLAPVQAKVLPITDAYLEYAEKVTAEMRTHGIRTETDTRSDKIGAKIRDAEMMKVPYMLIVGANEAENNTVSIRKHSHGDIGVKPLLDAVEMFLQEIQSKGLDKK